MSARERVRERGSLMSRFHIQYDLLSIVFIENESTARKMKNPWLGIEQREKARMKVDCGGVGLGAWVGEF